MRPYRLPLKFIGLWAANLAVLLLLGITLDWNQTIASSLHLSSKNLVYLYLFTGGILALLEQALWDKLKGN